MNLWNFHQRVFPKFDIHQILLLSFSNFPIHKHRSLLWITHYPDVIFPKNLSFLVTLSEPHEKKNQCSNIARTRLCSSLEDTNPLFNPKQLVRCNWRQVIDLNFPLPLFLSLSLHRQTQLRQPRHCTREFRSSALSFCDLARARYWHAS